MQVAYRLNIFREPNLFAFHLFDSVSENSKPPKTNL